MNRATAVAGTWYPGTREALKREVDEYLHAAATNVEGELRAIIGPMPASCLGSRRAYAFGPRGRN